MAEKGEKFEKRRLRSSNLTVIISISLVLFLLGIFGLIIINAQSYAEYIKRELKLEAFFKNEYDPKQQDKELEAQTKYIDHLKKEHKFVESIQYISKEKASQIAKQQLGISDLSLFEENIYPASIQITLKPDFINPKQIDSISIKQIDSIKQVIASSPLIDEVINDNELMIKVYKSIDQITFWLIGFAAIFLIIVIILINNSIRLKIYSKRFSIKTMQLVGAKRRFIMKPFLIEGALLGFIAALSAALGIGGVWNYFSTRVGQPAWNDKYIYLIAFLFVLGITIAVFSTLIAAWRYLRLRTDQLYE